MNRILYIALLFIPILLSLNCKKRGIQDGTVRPNMIVVLVDDMRWDEYGFAGHNYIKTPNIDRLAKEGAQFLNAFCTTPLCSPSRASFLTGQYAHKNGITDNVARDSLSHQLITFPKYLNESGYATAFIGKWHMGNDNSRRPGWDYWVSLKGQGEATNPFLNINGKEQQINGYVTDVLVDYSLQFIRSQKDRPFLLYLSHKALHPNVIQQNDGRVANIGSGGFVPAPRHRGLYDSAVFIRRPNFGIFPLDKPALSRPIDTMPALGLSTATAEKTIRERAEMLMAVDDGLGMLFKELEKQGVLDNTVFVFTSDHGFFYGEHGLDEERRLAYEESIRIPMLIRYPPKVKAGSQPDQIILSIDLAPTLLELSGLKANTAFQGKSVLPIFGASTFPWRNSILIEYYSDKVFPRIRNMGYKAVRTERYKYIHYLELNEMDELYDLQQDPYELKNLFFDKQAKGLLIQMKQELDNVLELTK